jgi:hypothetical protein
LQNSATAVSFGQFTWQQSLSGFDFGHLLWVEQSVADFYGKATPRSPRHHSDKTTVALHTTTLYFGTKSIVFGIPALPQESH